MSDKIKSRDLYFILMFKLILSRNGSDKRF